MVVFVIVPLLLLRYNPFTFMVVALTVKLGLMVNVLPELIVINDKFAVFAFTVTFLPLSIYAISPFPGIAEPADPPDVKDHVELEFQLPVAIE